MDNLDVLKRDAKTQHYGSIQLSPASTHLVTGI